MATLVRAVLAPIHATLILGTLFLAVPGWHASRPGVVWQA
jgi:hypothetical protein